MTKELVITAPTQIKANLNIANIYNLTIADFYAKARKMAGYDVTAPFLWNVNGKPIVKMAQEKGIDTRAESLSEFATDLIRQAEQKLKEHYLDYDFSVRDDQIQEQLSSLISGKYVQFFKSGVTGVNECPSCETIYGSDPSISMCRECGASTRFHQRPALHREVSKADIQDKMEDVSFYPNTLKVKLCDFMSNLPDEYNLLLEKNRQYTVSHNGTGLDPRFATIMMLAAVNNSEAGPYDIRTVIHGDVVKKFDYYAFAYMDREDMPTRVVSHSLLLGEDKKKLRWRNDNGTQGSVFEGVKNKELRAFFLKHSLTQNVVVDPAKIKENMKGLVRLYVTMSRILEQRNLGTSVTPDDAGLRLLLTNFHSSVEKLKLADAFENMRLYVDKSWKIVKDNKLSPLEHKTIADFKQLYFGE